VVKGITDWINHWIRQGLLFTEEGRVPGSPPPETELKNKDLWLVLLKETNKRKVDWEWVPGHAGVAGNEQADRLAVNISTKLKIEIAHDMLEDILSTLKPGSIDFVDSIQKSDGAFKSSIAVTDGNYSIGLQGAPHRNPVILLDVSNTKDKELIINEIKAQAKGRVIKAVNVKKENRALFKEHGFKPQKGSEKARTYIFTV